MSGLELPRVLWHWTCHHGMERIGARGYLRPHTNPLLSNLGPVIWLTDEEELSNAWDLGLTSDYLSCDRTHARYRTNDTVRAQPYDEVRHLIGRRLRNDLESFGRPELWWVCSHPMWAELDFVRDEQGAERR